MFKNILNLFKSKEPVINKDDIEIKTELVITEVEEKEYDEKALEKELISQVNFTPEQTNNYQIESICPYCNTELPKMPTRKSKCKACGEQIILRTHYSTKEKSLLTEKQLELYEKESKIYFKKKKIFKGFLAGYKDVLNSKSSIENSLKKEHSKKEKEWHRGLYRNTTSTLGDFYYLQDEKIEALKLYTEVIYYDMNEPSNVGAYVIENNMQDEFPHFKPTKDTEPLPHWIGVVEQTLDELEDINLNDLFIEHNTLRHNELKVIPLTAKKVWNKIENHFTL